MNKILSKTSSNKQHESPSLRNKRSSILYPSTFSLDNNGNHNLEDYEEEEGDGIGVFKNGRRASAAKLMNKTKFDGSSGGYEKQRKGMKISGRGKKKGGDDEEDDEIRYKILIELLDSESGYFTSLRWLLEVIVSKSAPFFLFFFCFEHKQKQVKEINQQEEQQQQQR